MAKKSVGDIWKELQAATAPRGRVGGLGGLAYTQRAQARPATKAPGSGFIESLQAPAAGRDSHDAVLVGVGLACSKGDILISKHTQPAQVTGRAPL